MRPHPVPTSANRPLLEVAPGSPTGSETHLTQLTLGSVGCEPHPCPIQVGGGRMATAVLRDSVTGQSEGCMAHGCTEVEWAVGCPGAEEIPGWSAGLGLKGSPWGVLLKSPRPGPDQ